MSIRQPVVAGRFYPGEPSALARSVRGWLDRDAGEDCARRPWALMLPHAGHMFCGTVIGATLAGVALPRRLIILCPNHTGRGAALGVWPSGGWVTPLGALAVDEELASALLNSGGGFEADRESHLAEHSIEVLLPFLQLAAAARPAIVPVCVGTRDPASLAAAGEGLAAVLASPAFGDSGLVISSDMNHYESEKITLFKDQLALDRALAGDAAGLLDTVVRNRISMCGAAPLALALHAAASLGGVCGELVAHETSARVSGDAEHVVGYAGMRFFRRDSEHEMEEA